MAASLASSAPSFHLKMKKLYYFNLFFVFIFLHTLSADATRSFFRGRRQGGNLQLHISDTNQELPPEEWFTQTLDHFDFQNEATWKQRFYRNATFYKPGGPVFLMVGGEGAATADWMVAGAWMEYAKKYGALCFQLEHRFYGKSHPTLDLSVDALRYLSSEQALADLAAFIEDRKKDLPAGSKWVLFGGSYPGSLAAWARARYPHLVHAAVSASGPLRAVEDFKDYYTVVEDALRSIKPDCAEAVANATGQLGLLLSHRVGQQTAATMFQLCQPIDADNPLDTQNLYETLASVFADIVQYNRDNRISGRSNVTVDTICDYMEGGSCYGVDIKRLASLSNLMLQMQGKQCLDHSYASTVGTLTNTSWQAEASEGGRQWTYQTCTEFGFFQTSTRPQVQRLFGHFPQSLFEQQCRDIFGEKFTPEFLAEGIAKTNTEYGALSFKADRVVFVHGSVDPWHALGVVKTLGPKTPAIYINGTAHCANMYPPSADDPPELIAARSAISNYIGQWLAEP